MDRNNSNFENCSFGLWECQNCGCLYQTRGRPKPDSPRDFNEIRCEYYANSRNSWKKHKWKLIERVSYEEYRRNGGYGAVNREKSDVKPAVNESAWLTLDIVASALSGKGTSVFTELGRGTSNPTVTWKNSSQRASEVKQLQAEEQAVFEREDKEGRFSGKRRFRNKYFEKTSDGWGCILFIIIVIVFIIFVNSFAKTIKNVAEKSQAVSASSAQASSSSHSSKSYSDKYASSQVTAFKRALFSCGGNQFQGTRRTEVKDIGRDVMVINGRDIPYDSRSGVPYGMYLYSSDNGGTFIKPTFAGYDVYSYSKPSDISGNTMTKTASYICTTFYENARFPFLKRENVNNDFINLYDKSDLKLIRNSIFASHGYIFKSQDMVDFFKKYPWYTPSNRDLDNYSKTEKDNVKFIKIAEDKRG